MCNYFNWTVKPLQSLCIGFNKLDINSIDYNICKPDPYLGNIDFNILSNSFSFHYDCVKDNLNSELLVVAKSIDDIPYIVKHGNLYGFQFHRYMKLDIS